MADYSKWKVTELKAELKTRGVPQTGLRLKQDFIDKLVALDSEAGKESAVQDAVKQSPAAEEEKKGENIEEDVKPQEPIASQQSATESLPTEGAPSPQKQNAQQGVTSSQTAQLEEPQSKDTAEEASQVGKDEQTSIDRPPSRPEEPTTAEETPETNTRDGETSAPAQEQEGIEESAISQVTPMELPLSTDEDKSLPPLAEGLEDLRKRKRRSQSPPPSVETIKKSKTENEEPKVIFQEDLRKEDGQKKETQPPSLPADTKQTVSAGRQDPRFRDLLPPPQQRRSASPLEQPLQDDDRHVEPALHPATSAIYVRNLMRPLQPLGLKNHLITLASPASQELGAASVVEFFLDSIKTHCFALFDSVSTASRVRSKLHGAVWPNERDRKPLWVDFIPEDKVNDWIKIEQDSTTTSRGAPRWEVIYEETGDGIEAILQESRGSMRSGFPPTAPARRESLGTAEPPRESQPSMRSPRQQGGGAGFKALDDRFQSTKTKPKLYFLPVSRNIVEKRLVQFDALTRKDSHRRSNPDDDKLRRYTFEDIDVLVDGGPEWRGPANRSRGGGSWRGRR